ncbi:MAG TPA: ABC transporter substrate-binding protein [Bradyrhizobium sp.]|uniref:ABC transporter substrate-binding protein n=1 Tax=Bradyrhizobium sp. TaxID=376 RepID=UPI002C7BA6F0|nr:ABC transporter substrate-binding protein [Bradyrhizobium sp.]HTA99190.1 ABC transporter substrate-binding protein [Bradyrhizobium sp.]
MSDPLQDIKIGYLHETPSKIRISLIDVPAANDGLAGAQLGAEDDNGTGRFLNQHYTLIEKQLGEGDDPVAAMNVLADQGVSFIITSLDADRLLRVADAGQPRGEILINASAIDERLREEDCRANVIHVAPTRAMLADGLAQYLVWKKWTKWLLIAGSHQKDALFADALRHAATRFGARIVEQREFKDNGGARRTDSGVAEIQRQMPVVTQGAAAYDVLVAADESEVFAGYLPYRTWDPRPVAGSAGLVPTTWDAAFDQWGAVQLQNRFTKAFQRAMTAQDMQAWTAVRMIGEAAVRSGSADPGKMLAYIKSPEFSVAAFKGQKLTLRDWNLQLRQPILLFDGRNTVSVSPQEGFLHQVSELDTLGLDRPETKCKFK